MVNSIPPIVSATVSTMLGSADLEKMKYVFYQLNLMADGIMGKGDPNNEKKDTFYLRMLPPTSFTKPAEFLPIETPDGKLPISTYTGFRNLKSLESDAKALHYRIDYHRALDIDRGGNLLGAGKVKFKAPESGYFYIQPAQADNNITIVDSNFSTDDKDELISSDPLYDTTYGSIGVLVTNPENPRDGRVYLFCHMEYPNNSSSDGYTDQLNFYTSKNFPKANPNYTQAEDYSFGVFPSEWEQAIKVNGGEEIGFIGNDGTGSGPHIHLEVWEYFDLIDGDPIGGWRRVDPLSVFYGTANERSWIDLERDLDSPDTTTSLSFRTMEVYLNNQYGAVITRLHEEDDNPQNDEEKPEVYE